MRTELVLNRRRSLLSRLGDFLGEVGKEYYRQLQMERAIRELREMPDYLLSDIGLSRSEIPFVVREGDRDGSRRQRG
ncbi:MAG TPA: DUF1127 domain-containing protein [Kiloniellales bacterium]|jgi:uncharacterized protein YjiS (DUF1127 family)|nr:DUF1127 domain-containing protein [Kiloniellales bacterium]